MRQWVHLIERFHFLESVLEESKSNPCFVIDTKHGSHGNHQIGMYFLNYAPDPGTGIGQSNAPYIGISV